MYTVGVMNIAVELFSVLISLITVICLLTGADRKSELTRRFMRIVLCNIAALLCDTAAWAFDGGASAHAYVIVRAAKFMAYSLSYLMIPFLAAYIAALVGRNAAMPKTLTRVMYALYCAAVLLVIISQFNGMYYRFDENNTYQTRGMFWLSQALASLYMFVITAVALRYRKSISDGEIFYYALAYTFFPLLALIVQVVFWPEFEFIFIASTLSIVACYVGIQAQQAKLLKERELALAQSGIAALISQIRPHFLFNSLIAIQELCLIDPKTAYEAVGEFSRYLRGNIDSLSITEPVPFDKELHHVENYLVLEKKRFGDKLQIVYDISERDFKLPALTLQPIVENAVRHGVTKREEGGTLTISAAKTETGYEITVTDDGAGFDPHVKIDDGRVRVGMENVRLRLASMCGGTLEVKSARGAGTVAVIRVPG